MALLPIYLDHAATTPVDAEVVRAMLLYFGEDYGNPSSIHCFGQRAEHAVSLARRQVAEILACRPEEIVFTGCGSESEIRALGIPNLIS